MAVNKRSVFVSNVDTRAARRSFATVQAAKAGVGALLGLAFFAFVGAPDLAEGLALAGLCAPGLLALLSFTRISLAILESLALGLFAALIGYRAVLTGGLVSPLIVWLVLVPAEAALAGG